MTNFGLSKTKIISGLQCVKRLYLQIHQPGAAETSDQSERLINFGYQVQDVARGLHPEGEMVGNEDSIGEAIRQTDELLKKPGDRLLFEPAFQHIGVAVRADLLFRKRNRYRMSEVKASTGVKDYYYNDIAIQRWVIDGAGYPVKAAVVSHLDNTFVYGGDGNYEGLFKDADITEEIEPLQEQVPVWISELRKMLAGRLPKIEMGKQCSDPFDCEFRQFCSKGLPPAAEYPVELLPNGGRVAAELRAKGYDDLRKVPASELTSERHKWVHRITKSGRPGVDPQVLKIIGDLGYPRYYLDFETVQFAVPIWAGTRPYEQLPFQWSCHIEREGGDVIHKEFLDIQGTSPMRPFAESLIATVGQKGPILVYGHFESTILSGLISRFPDLEVALTKIRNRIRDLLLVTRQNYYHRDMKGSWSLKAVLPTIAPDLSYAEVGEVQHGGAAQAAYLEIINRATTDERRATLIRDLGKYCALDTLGLVRLTRYLGGVKVT